MSTPDISTPDIKEVVKEKYGEAARRVTAGQGSSCCGATACCGTEIGPITRDLYDQSQTSVLPEEPGKASTRCRNTTAVAQLHTAETELLLGSGGGLETVL